MQVLDRNKKVVIWGYPEETHTHSYIHKGFYRALQHLGYDVVWVDDLEESTNLDLSDSIVITEKNVMKFLPIKKDTKYFIHNLEDDFVSQSKIDNDNVYNFLVYHDKYSWDDSIEKIDDYSWFCKKTNTPVIMWGTDLLPEEIDKIKPCKYSDDKEDVIFVGTVQGKNLINFAHICANNGKNFYNLGGYTGSTEDDEKFLSSKKSIDSIRDSFISFDIREDSHLDNGYVPCRIFKNISYGIWTGSNSEKVSKFFEGYLTINSDLESLYFSLIEDYKNCSSKKMRKCMNFIRDNHTYINRVNSLFSVL